MTRPPHAAPDREAAKHAGKASVRNAIGKLLGDDDAGTPPGAAAEERPTQAPKDPRRR